MPPGGGACQARAAGKGSKNRGRAAVSVAERCGGTGHSRGSSGAGDYRLEAFASAYVSAHVLTAQPLNWTEAAGDSAFPVAVSAGTGGSGDDLRVEFVPKRHCTKSSLRYYE